jgi:predicted nucleic acid-binding protein
VVPAPFPVVLDANVLFPFSLRDTLLRAAQADRYRLHWSREILDEMARNIVLRGQTTTELAQKLVDTMTRAFPDAMVTGYESLIAGMPNHPKDRHVVAVAVKIGAGVIVTSNLRDFRSLPEHVEAQSPDTFLCNLFDLDPDGMSELVRKQAAELRRPPRTLEELLVGLAKMVPEFVAAVREHRRRVIRPS